MRQFIGSFPKFSDVLQDNGADKPAEQLWKTKRHTEFFRDAVALQKKEFEKAEKGEKAGLGFEVDTFIRSVFVYIEARGASDEDRALKFAYQELAAKVHVSPVLLAKDAEATQARSRAEELAAKVQKLATELEVAKSETTKMQETLNTALQAATAEAEKQEALTKALATAQAEKELLVQKTAQHDEVRGLVSTSIEADTVDNDVAQMQNELEATSEDLRAQIATKDEELASLKKLLAKKDKKIEELRRIIRQFDSTIHEGITRPKRA